mmetsp:Transcript_52365/g.122854  ORF Transcript_52365/g.122854 Transcript_52365/m.122854 type:complete len:360 (-) Transcript_52365:189-1268(-)
MGISSRKPPTITSSAEGSSCTSVVTSAPRVTKLAKAPLLISESGTGENVKLMAPVPLSARRKALSMKTWRAAATTPSAALASIFLPLSAFISPDVISGFRALSLQASWHLGMGLPVASFQSTFPLPSRWGPQKILPSGQPPWASHSDASSTHTPCSPVHSIFPPSQPSQVMPLLTHWPWFLAQVRPSGHRVSMSGSGHAETLLTGHWFRLAAQDQSPQRNLRFFGQTCVIGEQTVPFCTQPSMSQNIWSGPHWEVCSDPHRAPRVALPPKQACMFAWHVPAIASSSGSLGHRKGFASSLQESFRSLSFLALPWFACTIAPRSSFLSSSSAALAHTGGKKPVLHSHCPTWYCTPSLVSFR